MLKQNKVPVCEWGDLGSYFTAADKTGSSADSSVCWLEPAYRFIFS